MHVWLANSFTPCSQLHRLAGNSALSWGWLSDETKCHRVIFKVVSLQVGFIFTKELWHQGSEHILCLTVTPPHAF